MVQKPLVQTLRKFLHLFHVVVARSLSDDSAMHYVLPSLWMTSLYGSYHLNNASESRAPQRPQSLGWLVGEWSHAAFSDDYVWAAAIACSMRCESHEGRGEVCYQRLPRFKIDAYKRCSMIEMRWNKYEVSLASPVWTQIRRPSSEIKIRVVKLKTPKYYYYYFWPSVDMFPREFKNWDIQNWVGLQIYQSMQSGVGKLSCNKTALKRCTSTETLEQKSSFPVIAWEWGDLPSQITKELACWHF